MSHISSGVEYALHCLLYLTKPLPGVTEANVRDLAELQGVPAEFLAKVFTKLHKSGLVVATEGAKGGFTLARPADEITVNDVVVAIDGQKALFECKEIRARCAVFEGNAPEWATSGVCSIHAVMLDAQEQMQKALANYTLADIAAEVAPKVKDDYAIQIIKWFEQRPSARRSSSGSAKV